MTRFDKVCIAATFLTIVLVGLLLWRGDQTFPQVSSAEWKGPTTQLLLIFNRPMDQKSVEKEFQTTPPLKGKFSWVGRKLAFTANEPLQYGTKYMFSLKSALDANGRAMQDAFRFEIPTKENRLVYIGTEEKELHRLVLYHLQTQKKELLTPDNILINKFLVSPDGESVFFLGIPQTPENQGENPTEIQNLYRVDITTKDMTLLSDSKDYINEVFDLSPDGNFLAIDRTQRAKGNLTFEKRLWLLDLRTEEWQRFWKEEFGFDDIHFSPDSQYILSIEGNVGTYVLAPLAPDPQKIQLLGNFANAYGFSSDGKNVIFRENDNANDIFTLSNHLVFLTNSGMKNSLFSGLGNVTSPILLNDGEKLYFLLKKEKDPQAALNQTYQIYFYDFKTKALALFTDKLEYSVESIALSPDGKFLVFERALNSPGKFFNPDIRFASDIMSGTYEGSELWTKNLTDGTEIQLPLTGRDPQWVP